LVGSIYRHHALPISDFNELYLGVLLEKVNKQGIYIQEAAEIMGDFNINNLLNTNNDIQ